MIPLHSALTDQERDLIHTRNELAQLSFTYGGNWDYDHGSFDKPLNSKHTVWLRLPFHVVQGEMDAEVQDTEARIRFGIPLVFKHLYEDGLDQDARVSAISGLVNQFQSPEDPDAAVEPHWVEKARSILEEVEHIL